MLLRKMDIFLVSEVVPLLSAPHGQRLRLNSNDKVEVASPGR